VGGIGIFLCVIALAVVVLFVKPGFIKVRQEPNGTLIPATEPSSAVIPATETPVTEPSATVPLGETATASPAIEATLLPTSPTLSPQADIHVAPFTSQLRVGEKITVTATATNTGRAPFVGLRYQLLGPWEPPLRTTAVPIVSAPDVLAPGMSATTTFVLEAVRIGTTTLQVAISMETPGELPRPGGEVSEEISVSVVE
jgi:hypothetical protein